MHQDFAEIAAHHVEGIAKIISGPTQILHGSPHGWSMKVNDIQHKPRRSTKAQASPYGSQKSKKVFIFNVKEREAHKIISQK